MQLRAAIEKTVTTFLNTSQITSSPNWQATKSPSDMVESLFVTLDAVMPDGLDKLREQVNPNLPWADVHFEERVGGKPLNPGESYKLWPFYGRDEQMRSE